VNRLWVRLSLAFGAVVMLAALVMVTVAFLVQQVGTAGGGAAPLNLEGPGGLAEILSRHYQERGNWHDVAPLMAAAGALLPSEGPFGAVLELDDAGGQVVATTRSRPEPSPAHDRSDALSTPIVVASREVGTLYVLSASEDGPLDRLRALLLSIAIVGGLLGLLFGVRMGRGLAAPLDRLAAAAREVGAGRLDTRVAPSGSREMREVATAFNTMADDLKASQAQRRDMVADIAHELRTPLSVLQANIQALQDGVYSLDQSEVARLGAQAILLSRLVEDLHALAQADSGQLRLNREPVDVAALATRILANFQSLAEQAGLSLDQDIPVDLPRPLADQERMNQVLHNLVANAIRHTPHGGRVSIRAWQEGASLQLEVADTGEGIQPADLAQVFERFYRVDRSRRRAQGGTGLGLSIARAIVEAQGGTIDAYSTGVAGEGSRFRIGLPLDGAGGS